MLILTETTDKIQVVLGSAVTTNQLPCMSAWRDITTSAYTPGRTVINTNSTTDIDLVGSPASSTQRVIDFLSVYNADTTNKTVTVKFDANGTEYVLWKGTLATLEHLEYADGQGFRVLSSDGVEKIANTTGTNPVSSSVSVVVLGSDVTNNNGTANTIADVTGLSFAVTAGNTYRFKFVIPYTSAAATTGSRWAINGPGSPTLLNITSHYPLTATTETNNAASAYNTPAASNASSLTAGNVAIIEGIIKPSANGTVIARFASEISASAIVAKAGAYVEYQQVL